MTEIRQQSDIFSNTGNLNSQNISIAELFNLSSFPVLDIEKGCMILGSEQLLKDMIHLMLKQGIDEDKIKMEQAYVKKQWGIIQSSAHRMKGGAAYCGMTKLQMACEYLENYSLEGQANVLDQLYQQLLEVIDITKKNLNTWL